MRARFMCSRYFDSSSPNSRFYLETRRVLSNVFRKACVYSGCTQYLLTLLRIHWVRKFVFPITVHSVYLLIRTENPQVVHHLNLNNRKPRWEYKMHCLFITMAFCWISEVNFPWHLLADDFSNHPSLSWCACFVKLIFSSLTWWKQIFVAVSQFFFTKLWHDDATVFYR